MVRDVVGVSELLLALFNLAVSFDTFEVYFVKFVL